MEAAKNHKRVFAFFTSVFGKTRALKIKLILQDLSLSPVNYGPFSPFYYLRLIGQVVND